MNQSKPEVLAIIPARGGSKGIKRKNIVDVAGKPLIAWTIERALNSSAVSRLIVSTDDDEIAEVAQAFGAECPFKRAPELARDDTPGLDVIFNAVELLSENEDYHPSHTMILQATSPLRTTEDIDKVAKFAFEKDADHVITVTEAEDHPFYTFSISENGEMLSFMPESLVELMRRYPNRQDLPPAYIENGAIYLSKTKVLLEKRSVYYPQPLAIVMPKERSIDIDTRKNLATVAAILEREIP